jgi:hypothetical protein
VNTLKDVKMTMRALAGDPDGNWLTDAYMVPIINHVYRLQINYLQNFGSTAVEDVRVIPGLKQGTTDLKQYMAQPNQPLYGLKEPYEDGIDWKQTGQPDAYYLPARRCGKLPDITPAAPGPRFQMFWEWRAFRLVVTPMTFDIDLRVRGDYGLPPLLKDDDMITLHPGLQPVLTEESLAACWRERQNAGQLPEYKLTYTEALDDIGNDLTRGDQGAPIRLPRFSRRSGRK